jgi:UDP-N-acetylglucosamine 2-epimerase (non-hydrolysing)
MRKFKIIVFVGTRPEIIKMAVLIDELKRNSSIECLVVSSGQHSEMSDVAAEVFNLKFDKNLNLMSEVNSISDLGARILTDFKCIIDDFCPDLVLVHGDTSTAFFGALTAFLQGVSIGHVEAGLRTNDIFSPFPEEANRQLISRMASFNFCPTQIAVNNLINEGIDSRKIFLTGNTVVDSLLKIHGEAVFKKDTQEVSPYVNKKIILVTVHRRENHGERLTKICEALKQLAIKYADVQLVLPLHLNPAVKNVISSMLDGFSNISLVAHLSYIQFVSLMANSYLILTDSGGVQEEAPTFGVPVLVLRDSTERPEAVMSGSAKLVGAETESIVSEVSLLIDSYQHYQSMSRAKNPFGDGFASQRIIDHILDSNK